MTTPRRAVLWAALLGALLAGAPRSTFAATNASVTGVPASVTWGSTSTGGGASSELRVLLSNSINMTATSAFIPVFGITQLCRVGSPTPPPSCSTNTADEVQRGVMQVAVGPQTCTGTTTCFTSCTTGMNTVLSPMISTTPQNAGVGVAPRAPGYPVCRDSSGVNQGIGCNSCSANASSHIVFGPMYIAVTVPAGKDSGTYQATLTFAVN